ncbi:Uracil phosphoribosyltransferase-like protein [Aphelenchoides bicaudatus]|nr:Uracil phosphoribosyltransferase-like protein [Aphelenchoides bicaudatus]
MTSLPKNLVLLPQTKPVQELHTILRNKDTDHSEFVFCADRLMKQALELGLNQLPHEQTVVTTPTSSEYRGLSFKHGNCGVSICRSGESMENALRKCCRSIRIGKILIGDNQQVLYTRFMSDISKRRILLLYPVLRTGLNVQKAISLLLSNKVKQENIFLITLFANQKCVEELLKVYPAVTIITTQLADNANHFTNCYFGTD